MKVWLPPPMKYCHHTLGKERTDACLARIKERVQDTDPEYVAKTIVEYEVMVTCRRAPFTIEMLDEMLESDLYEFGNGWNIDALKNGLSKVDAGASDNLRQEIRIVLFDSESIYLR